jgi:hypothetical protein
MKGKRGHRTVGRRRLAELSRRPVHLQAQIDDEMVLFSYDGNQSHQQTITDSLPKPAHRL